MMNLIRNIRRKRKVKELEYHRNKIAEYDEKHSELVRKHGLLYPHDDVIPLIVAMAIHRRKVHELTAELNK